MKTQTLYCNFLSNPVLAAFIFLGLCKQGFAGEPERLSADRPGFAWGTHSVSPGRIYVEGGFQFSWNPSISDFRYMNIPVLNLRTGLADGVELFISWDGWKSRPANLHNSDESFADRITIPFMGGKLRLKDSDALSLTALALLEPNYDDDFFAVNPSLGILWETPLSESFEFFGMAMSNMDFTPDDSQFNLIFAVGLATSLNQNIDIFLEHYTFLQNITGKWLHGNEAGIQYFISNDIQLDVFWGFSHGNKSDHYAGIGITRRL